MDGDGRVRDLAAVDVTALLADLSKGKPEAADQLIPVVYGELRRLASSYMRREREGHTLQATALVHEAYMKLVEQRSVNWQSRTHFFGIAAQIMRRLLVDHARGHLREHRAAAYRGGMGQLCARSAIPRALLMRVILMDSTHRHHYHLLYQP